MSKSTALVIVLGFLCVTSTAAAEDDPHAHFDRGMAFFNDGDYVAAMVEFKKAYELDPKYQGLYNLGQTARELRDYAQALDSFERYLAEGGSEIDAQRVKNVEGWVAELRQKVAQVTLTTSVSGAEVSVDDVLVGKTPLTKPLRLNAGRRRVVVTKDGFAPLTRFIDVAGTETKTIELELSSLVLEKREAANRRADRRIPIEHTAWPWIGLGATAAVGIATGVVGGLALSKKSSFDDALATFPTTESVIEESRADAQRFAIAADVLGGVTGAFAVLTVIAFAVDYGRSAPSAENTGNTKLIVQPGFLGVESSF